MRRKIMGVAAVAALAATAAPADAQAACAQRRQAPVAGHRQAAARRDRLPGQRRAPQARPQQAARQQRPRPRRPASRPRHGPQALLRAQLARRPRLQGTASSAPATPAAARAILGENLAWGSHNLATPRSIVRGWMKSPGHRANMLQPQFRHIGIGIVRAAPTGANNAATYAAEFGRALPH